MPSFSRSRLVLLAVFALLASACDKGGLYPLLEPIDVLVPCGPDSTTWVRSTDTGTEILVLGSATPTTASMAMETRCFQHAVIDHDSSTVYESGSYTLQANGSGTASYGAVYRFHYVSTGSVLARVGATRDPVTQPISTPITLTASGSDLVATVDGVTGTYTNLYDLVASMHTTTQTDGENLFRLINLPVYTSATRVLGFGGAGMTSYVDLTTFKAAIGHADDYATSTFSVHVKSAYSMPDTDIDYNKFEDLSGVEWDGLYTTVVNLTGNGTMTGAPSWSLRKGPAATDVAIRGTLDFSQVKIANGVAGGGSYTLAITSPNTASFTIDYTLATNIDLRSVLPVR